MRPTVVVHEPRPPEHRWQIAVTILAAIVLLFMLPPALRLGPTPLLAICALVLLIPLVVFAPYRTEEDAHWVRLLAFALLAVVVVGNLVAVVRMIDLLLSPRSTDGRALLQDALIVWFLNVIAFALIYWQLDRGGPLVRWFGRPNRVDFLFPQMTDPEWQPASWRPQFFDYMYVSFTNATAFSPTDTMPLTPWAKTGMTVQSLVSLITIVLVTARAVNIIK